MAEVKMVQKLSPKSMGWGRGQIDIAKGRVPAEGGRVHLGRIVGIVSGIKEMVNNETGEIMTGLKGNFRGVAMRLNNEWKAPADPVVLPPVEGETINSGVCYLPSGIQSMIETAYRDAAQSDRNATVRFTLDLYAIPANNKAGYSFDADNIVEAQAADPLSDMLGQAHGLKALALAAPTAAPSQEAPTETADSHKGSKAPAKA